MEKIVVLLERIKNDPNRIQPKANENYGKIADLVELSKKWVNTESTN